KYTQSQRDVLALYRRGLRAIRGKPQPAQPHFVTYLRHAFRAPSQGGGVKRRDFAAIDYLMRKGRKMVEDVFESSGVKDIHLPPGAEEFAQK
ncbi:hypothetical protein IE81DRAFT_276958, partial [Ceraceosorus guamensis]